MIRSFRRRAAYGPAASDTQHASKLNAELLEDRSTPATFTPNAFGGGVFAPFDNPNLEVRSTSGDVNGDGIADIITAEGPGPGSGSQVRIFDGRAAQFSSQAVLIADFYAYSNVAGAGQAPGFAGGVFVTAGDFNGDGFDEVVTSPGAGASGHIKVFDFNAGGTFAGSNPALRASFYAYPGFLGEIRATTLSRGTNIIPLLVTASGAGTTQSDIRLYANVFNIGQVDAGTLVNPLSQSFPYPGYLGGVSVAGGTDGRLFVSPNTGVSQVSVFTFNPFSFGGSTLVPGETFNTGLNSPTDVRLGSADVNGDGVLDVLTSSVGANSSTPISAFSVNDGFTALNNLNGFQGFGFFGNTWLGSSAFTGASLNTATPGATFFNAGIAPTVGGSTFFNPGGSPSSSVLSPGVM